MLLISNLTGIFLYTFATLPQTDTASRTHPLAVLLGLWCGRADREAELLLLLLLLLQLLLLGGHKILRLDLGLNLGEDLQGALHIKAEQRPSRWRSQDHLRG